MSPDGKLVASGSGLNVMVWDARTGKPTLTIKGHTVPVFGVAFSPDGKRIVSGGFGRIYPDGSTGPEAGSATEVRIWDAQTGRELLAINGQAARGPRATSGEVVDGVAFSPDGKRIASAQKVWDAETGQEIFTLGKFWRGGGTTVAFSPDGKYLATGDKDGAKLWNAQSGEELYTLPGAGNGTPFCPVVAFSPDSKRLAGGGFGGMLKVWDVETGREIFTASGGDGRFGIAFSPDGKRLASSQKIWDAATGQELLTLDGGGYGIAFSPDGNLLTCNTGGSLKIYDATPLPEKP